MRMASATLNGETTMTPGEDDNIPKAPPLGLRERYIKILVGVRAVVRGDVRLVDVVHRFTSC